MYVLIYDHITLTESTPQIEANKNKTHVQI